MQKSELGVYAYKHSVAQKNEGVQEKIGSAFKLYTAIPYLQSKSSNDSPACTDQKRGPEQIKPFSQAQRFHLPVSDLFYQGYRQKTIPLQHKCALARHTTISNSIKEGSANEMEGYLVWRLGTWLDNHLDGLRGRTEQFFFGTRRI